MMRACNAAIAVLFLAVPVLGQTPQPFPRPGAPQQEPPSKPAPAPQTPAPKSPAQPATAPADPNAPNPATIYFPVYPAAQFLRSYDAGRGQRYYIYGTTAPYVELVAYYRTQLKDRGDQVFLEPPTYMFSIGRYREETMSFPPGVTIKDWTWGGSQGYPNPKGNAAQPGRFPSIIMILPPPPGTPPLGR
jgi:hypothetical protein